jgi:transcription elongation factor GreA
MARNLLGMATKLSRETHDRLQAEFADLSTRGKIEIARRIEAARELGDLSENGEYHAAKEEQGKMDARMRQIRAILDDAEIVAAVDTTAVSTGATVTIKWEGEDDTETYLLGSIEERRDGVDIMSPDSPMGRALMGKTPGQVAEYQVNGRTMRVEVVSISA